MAEQTGRQELEETLYNINIYLSNLTAQNEQRYKKDDEREKKDDEREKRREQWEEKFGEKNISKNNQYLSRAIKSELNGLGKDIGNEIANSLPPALKELTSSITNSLSKSFSTYNKIMDAADKDRQKQLEKLKKDYINGNANMPQSILDIFGGGSSGGSTGTTGSGGGGGGTPTSKVKMGDFDPEDAAGASKLGKLLPDIPGLGGLIGGAAKFAGPIALAGAALQIGGAVNKFQKQMAESGAITGEGRGAGLGAEWQAFKMGANPFGLLSKEFADKIVTTFRSAGFKDNLAYSLSDSFGSITKQIGEKLSEQILPSATVIATTLQNQNSGIGNVQDQQKNLESSMAGFATVMKSLSTSAKESNVSSETLLSNFNEMALAMTQIGTITDKSLTDMSAFVKSMYTQEGLGTTANPNDANALTSAFLKSSPFLAGTKGIAAPLALVGSKNQGNTEKAFIELFDRLAAQMPESLKNDPNGYETYAAYLIPGFLSGIGMGNLSVTTVATLLRNRKNNASLPQPLSSTQTIVKAKASSYAQNARTAAPGIAKRLNEIAGSSLDLNTAEDQKIFLNDAELKKDLESTGLTPKDLLPYMQKGGSTVKGGFKDWTKSDSLNPFSGKDPMTGTGEPSDQLTNFLSSMAIKKQFQSIGVSDTTTTGKALNDLIDTAKTGKANQITGIQGLGDNYDLAQKIIVKLAFTSPGMDQLIKQISTEIKNQAAN
jgi:hypothetical protein